jgi:tetratricopeptide (TPR) repeat protein
MENGKVTEEIIQLINQAANLINEGQALDGRAKLFEIVEKAKEAKAFDILPNVHLNLATTFRADGKMDEAEDHLDKAKTAAQKYGTVEDQAFVALQRFHFFYGIGRNEPAHKEIFIALEFMKKADGLPVQVKADIYQAAGTICMTRRELVKALELLEEGKKLAEESDYDYGVCACLSEMGVVHTEMVEYEKAEECYKTALATFEKGKNYVYMAGVLHNLGNLEMTRKDYVKSAEYYDRAVELKSDHSEDPANLEASLRLLAVSLAATENWEKAAQTINQAFLCTLNTGPRNAAYITSLAHHEVVKQMLHVSADLSILDSIGDRMRHVVETVVNKIQAEEVDLDEPVGKEKDYDERLIVFFLLVRYAKLLKALAAGETNDELAGLAVWLKEATGDDLDMTNEFPAAKDIQ